MRISGARQENGVQPYLEFKFEDTDDLVSVYDELPLWSAPFGQMLLDTVRLRGVSAALDIGCGTGFPLIELAERFGAGVRVYGIDPWQRALKRVAQKLAVRGVANVEAICGVAERLPFPDDSFDLIVSNNGINNVADPSRVLAECHRVARPGGQLVLTANLPGTMRELYEEFANTLRDLKRNDAIERMHQHIDSKRKPLEDTIDMVRRAGFGIARVQESAFRMRFADGSALFNHYFIKLAFLEPWTQVVDERDRAGVFRRLEERLNARSADDGELSLTIPFACIEARRPVRQQATIPVES